MATVLQHGAYSGYIRRIVGGLTVTAGHILCSTSILGGGNDNLVEALKPNGSMGEFFDATKATGEALYSHLFKQDDKAATNQLNVQEYWGNLTYHINRIFKEIDDNRAVEILEEVVRKGSAEHPESFRIRY